MLDIHRAEDELGVFGDDGITASVDERVGSEPLQGRDLRLDDSQGKESQCDDAGHFIYYRE